MRIWGMLECMNAVQSHGVPHRAGYHRGRTSNGCLDLQEASSLNTNAAPHAVCNFAFICTDQQITCFKLLSYTGTCKETRKGTCGGLPQRNQGSVQGFAATQPREREGVYRNATKGTQGFAATQPRSQTACLWEAAQHEARQGRSHWHRRASLV